MPTLATFRIADRTRDGFTLLELLVVLAIMGLAAGLAAPGVLRSIESWQARAELDRLQDQVRGLPAAARATGRALRISGETLGTPAPPLRVEEGWTLRTDEAWTVEANGYCAGGVLHLTGSGRAWSLTVLPPFCDVERIQ